MIDYLRVLAIVGAWAVLVLTVDAFARQRVPWPTLTLAVLLVGAVMARLQ